MMQTDYRDAQAQTDQMASAAKAAADAATKSAATFATAWIADVDIVYDTAVSLNLAPRMKPFDVASAQYGDRVYVHPRDEPTLAGVEIGGVLLQSTALVPKTGGKVKIYHIIPAVGVGQILKIPLRLVGVRAVQ